MASAILTRIFSNRKVKTLAIADERGRGSADIKTSPDASTLSFVDQNIRKHETSSQMERTSRSPVAGGLKDDRSKSIPRGTSRARRASYDSVREQSDVPQSFTKFTPQVRDQSDESVVTDGAQSTQAVERWQDALLGRFKRTEVKGRRKSNSFSHLPRLSKVDRDYFPAVIEKIPAPVGLTDEKSLAPLEALPFELLENILMLLNCNNSTNEYASRYEDLVSCLQVSKPIHAATTSVLYSDISVPHSIIFSKFMTSINRDQSLATLVRRLDFSRYTNIGFGRSREASTEILNVTPATLKQCLDLMPNLHEFLVHEHIDDELTPTVLSTLFSKPSIQALDFCACSSKPFTQAFTNISTMSLQHTGPLRGLQRLSLHECTTLQAPVFEALLPRLPRLTHLDVAHTLITDSALLSIPHTARLTHLNLGRCTRVTGAAVVQFLTTHPAVKDTLIFLNLMAEPSRYRLLNEEQSASLIPQLPSSLRSLNLGGARLNASHIPLLRPLTRHLEELGLSGADIPIDDINGLFLSPPPSLAMDSQLPPAQDEPCSSLRYIDLSSIPAVTQAGLHFSTYPLTGRHTHPLEVIELGEKVLAQLQKSHARSSQSHSFSDEEGGEWIVRELGRRGWYVRQPAGGDADVVDDDGRRAWKMGARWWGMRKVPVAVQEVAGMYGFYAFKRI